MQVPAPKGGANPSSEKTDAELEAAKKAWKDASMGVEFRVHHGGGPERLRQTLKTKKGLIENYTWNIGDIDFDTDGSIFIRNPYLADAIMTVIARNFDKMQRGELTPKGEPQFLFRLTRDEGWSGEKQNMVC